MGIGRCDGPFKRLPSLQRPRWTVLVQGVDLIDDAAHGLLQRFRFVPDARLDDLMVSFATDGGGVGPHVDSYDVFLLQAAGRRRWRISRQREKLRAGAPLKLLANFRATREWVLEPGDMLYLPPGIAHEGVAIGESLTYWSDSARRLTRNCSIRGSPSSPSSRSWAAGIRIPRCLLRRTIRPHCQRG
jgi:50S ribosomal protein L16 3-hydroxylase